MTTSNSLSSQITKTPEGMKVWQQERAIIEMTERVCELMQEQGLSRAQLAEKMGKSRPYITQLLRGNANLTIRTMSDLYLALGRQFHPHDGPVTIDNCDGPVILSYVTGEDEGWVFPEASDTEWKVVG